MKNFKAFLLRIYNCRYCSKMHKIILDSSFKQCIDNAFIHYIVINATRLFAHLSTYHFDVMVHIKYPIFPPHFQI